ncbi:MAG: hypothetical protein A2428_10725 [Bdellovibrionales bacterium RIFOXYC1_FULL_54_43]|nr:MAG: hypothetical protein A2428_10725 [Bdellovibrionales bacterium RIFOXYC1_FULL_54_43]OFZ78349.1 MAG: hypothetical protein A2603_12490 [Bdellovibrionales bacterium RIFOXYD1_FULL_55_31]
MTSKSANLNESVLNALRTVMDPDLGKDLVSLNMIRDLTIGPDGTVSLRVVLTTPACPLKAKIEGDVRAALAGVDGVKGVQIKMDAEVRARKNPNKLDGVSHIIAVSSGKGGVGKSTVSVNLAVSLALEGASVGLMDADIYGPNIPTMMGVSEPPTVESDASRGDLLVPPSAHGIRVISMGNLIEGDQPLVWRGPMLHNIVDQFCHKVKWGKLDYLVVDMPPGTGDVQLSLAQLVPVSGAVLVTTPQEVAMQDVRKAFYMFEKVRIPMIGVVENMSYFRCDQCQKSHDLFGSGGGKLLAAKFGTELLGQIPILPEVRIGGDLGRPIVLTDPDSEPAKVFRDLSKKVAQRVSLFSQ